MIYKRHTSDLSEIRLVCIAGKVDQIESNMQCMQFKCDYGLIISSVNICKS